MRTTLSILIASLTVACGPLVMIPGGKLGGDVKQAPSDWSFSDATETVQLETRPDDPYSVNVWGIGAGPVFYVAGAAENKWVENIREDPRVRLRLGEDLYELAASPTDDPAEIETFIAGLKNKYDYELEPEQREGAQLFRLTPR